MNGVEPSASKLVQLAEGLNVNLLWLATGEGPMRPDEGEAPQQHQLQAQSNARFITDTVDIPRLDVRASAGAGAVGSSGEVIESMPFPASLLKAKGLNPANLRIIDVAGDSMEPTLESGDLVLVDISAKRIRAESLYVLVRDGEVFVKRAQRRMNGAVLISSDNERYPPEEFTEETAEALDVAGRVVWYFRSL